ncbi:MAG: LysR family transcriptional regulator, partial [Myxococcota bacterium]
MIAKKQNLELALPKWDDARLFLAVWRHGSLKRAAEGLGVNISTVSRRLEALERALHLPLFDRTPEGTLPTAAAAKLLPFAEAMEAAALGFAAGLTEFESEPEGVVHVTAPPGVVDPFLAPHVARLRMRYPRLRLEVSSRVDYLDLGRRQADLALRAHRPQSGDLVSKKLVATPWVILGSDAEALAP